MWCLRPCNREWPLPKATEAKLNDFAWLALGLPAFLAGKIKCEEKKGKGWIANLLGAEPNWYNEI